MVATICRTHRHLQLVGANGLDSGRYYLECTECRTVWILETRASGHVTLGAPKSGPEYLRCAHGIPISQPCGDC